MQSDNDVEQLSFPFAWTAERHLCLADKHMRERQDRWGDITIHRNSADGVWVVSKELPVIGWRGYISGSVFYLFPFLFFRGGDARRFVRSRAMNANAPLIDLTRQ